VVILVTLAVGLVFWLTGWALGAKAFDTFLVTVLLLVGASAAHIAAPFVRRRLGRESEVVGGDRDRIERLLGL